MSSHAMFYGSPSTMSPPSKSKLKRQSRLLSQVLSRTLSYKDRNTEATCPSLGASDDPAELSTQLSAPGILKVFGDNVCSGTHYKSVLATGSSSAQELVKEALERYALNPVSASQYVLCDVVGRFGSSGQQWQAECLRVLGDNEKPLLIQDLWKPKEGLSRRFELRKRSEVEELAARDVDTITAGINAQARKLQRNRAKGATTLMPGCKRNSTPPTLRRTVSETSLSYAGTQGEELKRHYSTLPEPSHSLEDSGEEPPAPVEERNGNSNMRYSLYQSPHLLLLQGYSQQHDSLVYLLNREQHTVGQRTPSSKPSISLSAPDILPLHCTIRRLRLSSRSRHYQSEERLVLEPIPGAIISVNFSEVGKATHSATSFEPGEFGQLLLKLTKMIQRTVWEKTKELAEKQTQHQDPVSLSRFTIADLVPDLQHILFWMSNSIELLYFVQQKSPLYIQNMEEELDVKGSKESLFSSTITASEEAMTVLEEVVMYTFQQCLLHLKVKQSLPLSSTITQWYLLYAYCVQALY
uniref:Rap associating with DIL domain n=1 Tax=Ornithorhynchus anatinus TaxID=9258 RepID=A0A6I8P8G6_ORNAN